MLYYFDETADQGYVDKASSIKEYGILAGWAFPKENKDLLEATFAPVLSNLQSRGYKKLHCTEIFKDNDNPEILEELYDKLLNLNGYVIIHEGAYLLGVKQHEQSLSNIKIHQDIPANIKIIESKERTRHYIELLEGVIVKLEECAKLEEELEVHMISDRNDKAIQDESMSLMNRLKSSTHTITNKTFDMETKQRIDRTYTMTTSCSIDFRIKRVKDISYLDRVTPLSFVADFICFELLRHFRRQMQIQELIKFQCPDTLNGFRLKHKIAFLDKNYFTDHFFMPSLTNSYGGVK